MTAATGVTGGFILRPDGSTQAIAAPATGTGHTHLEPVVRTRALAPTATATRFSRRMPVPRELVPTRAADGA
ncbi:MAG TPA: hypothetical protein VI357_09440 [Mycobacteriales bacterium]